MDDHFRQWWQKRHTLYSMQHSSYQSKPITVIDVYAAWLAGRDYEASQIVDGLADLAERMKEDIVNVRASSGSDTEARAAVRAALGGE